MSSERKKKGSQVILGRSRGEIFQQTKGGISFFSSRQVWVHLGFSFHWSFGGWEKIYFDFTFNDQSFLKEESHHK
jgi:hypothetical protein